MLPFIRNWIYSPIFPGDDDNQRRARILNKVLLTSIVYMSTLVVLLVIEGKTPFRVIASNTAGVLFLLFLRYTLLRGKTRFVGITSLLLALIWTTTVLALQGTIRTPTSANYLFIILLAGSLFYGAGVFYTFIASVLATGGLILAENFGWLPQPDYSVNAIQWLVYCALFAITGGIIYYVNYLMRSALHRAEKELTERTQVEISLRQNETRLIESQKRFMTIFQSSPIGIGIAHINGKYVDANDALCRLLGFSREEIIGRSAFDLNIWVSDEHHQIMRQQVRDTNGVRNLEALLRRKNGEFIDVNIIAEMVELNDQPFVISTLVDISERKRMDADLRKSQAETQAILNAIPDIMFELDPYGLIINYNCPIHDSLYVPPEVFMGKHYRNVMPPAAIDVIERALAQTAQQGWHRGGVYWLPLPAGRRWFELSIQLKKSSPGEAGNFIVLAHDITERKQTENMTQARLRISEYAIEHSLNALLQNELDELCQLTDSPIGFFSSVEPDQCTLSMQAWSTLTLEQMSVADVMGKHYPLDKAGVWADCVRTRRPVIHNDYASLPHRKGMPEGHVQVVREMVFPIIRDHKIVAIIGVGNKVSDYTTSDLEFASQLANMIWDITERKKAEEAEQEQRALAQALSNSAAVLNSTLDFDEVLNRIIDNVEQVVPYDTVSILLLEPSQKEAKIVSYRDLREHPDDMRGRTFIIADTPNLQQIIETGKPDMLVDIQDTTSWVFGTEYNWVRSCLGVPILVKNETIGFLYLSSTQPGHFTESDALRLQAFVNYAAVAIENARLYEQIQKLALTDPLTGVFNRTFFEAEMTRIEVGRTFPVSIIITDLDNMKITNDQLGHAAGDELLRRTVKLLQSVFRAEDIIARIGGDEFAILLPHTDSAAVEKIIDRIRRRLPEYNIQYPDLQMQFSVGVATAEQQRTLMETFILADQRMYTDKAAHKSRGQND